MGQPAHGAAAVPTGRQSPSGAGTSAVASSVGLREVDAGVYPRPTLCSTRRPATPTPPPTTRATRVQEGPRRLVQERSVVLGVWCCRHELPTVRVSELMTRASTAAARRAAFHRPPARSQVHRWRLTLRVRCLSRRLHVCRRLLPPRFWHDGAGATSAVAGLCCERASYTCSCICGARGGDSPCSGRRIGRRSVG